MIFVNEAEALSRFDGDTEIYLELIDTFLESTIADFGAMRQELQDGNVKQVAFRAHKLKGASLTLGAEDLASIASTIETTLRERYPEETATGNKAADTPLEAVAKDVDALETVYVQTTGELETIRKTLRTPR